MSQVTKILHYLDCIHKRSFLAKPLIKSNWIASYMLIHGQNTMSRALAPSLDKINQPHQPRSIRGALNWNKILHHMMNTSYMSVHDLAWYNETMSSLVYEINYVHTRYNALSPKEINVEHTRYTWSACIHLQMHVVAQNARMPKLLRVCLDGIGWTTSPISSYKWTSELTTSPWPVD